MDIIEQMRHAREIVQNVREYMHDKTEAGLRRPVSGVEEIPGAVRAFVVSLETIKNTSGFVLSPSTYDVKEQRDAILELIDKTDPLYALDVLHELCNAGKSDSRYLAGVRFHREVVEQIGQILKDFREEVHHE